MKTVSMETARILRERMSDGVLSFPLTSFTDNGELDPTAFRRYFRGQLEADPAAVFVACGTGEFFSLALDEYAEIVHIAVEETGGRMPVVAGVGYGWAIARQYAQRAAEAGVDAVLLMPHYLVKAPVDGLVEQVRRVAGATPLPVIVYQRDYVLFDAASVAALAGIPNVIGFKDGLGDLDLMQRIVSAVRTEVPGDFLYFNGLPTAEQTQLAYRAIGIDLYSSAVFCFVPEIALAFHQALVSGDDTTVNRLLDGFYRPFVELRSRGRGYAVSLVKAGVRLRGRDVGEVRPPLHEPSEDHVKELAELIERGYVLLQEGK